MRIGPFTIAERGELELMRAAHLNVSPQGGQGDRIVRVSLTDGSAGFGVRDGEYVEDLSDALRYAEFDRMRKNDGTVAGVLRAMTLPIRGADWYVEPASDDPLDRDIAAWVEDNLIHGMKQSWDYVLANALLMLPLGSMIFEPVFEIVDDETFGRPLYRLRRLYPRHPRTVKEWLTDGDGDFAGIVQSVWKDGELRDIRIDADDLVVFVNEQELADMRGTSVLRAARTHWKIKHGLYKIDAVGIERHNAGIDVGTMTGEQYGDFTAGGSGAQDSRFERESRRALETVRTGARNYLLEVPGFTYRIQGIEGATLPALPSIEHHNKQIARSVLMEWILMGDAEGARAVHADKTTLALQGLRSTAGGIKGTFNRHLIPRWVNANWPDVKAYPKVEHSRLDRRDVATVVDALEGIVPLGLVTPDPDVEDWLRELLEMPERPEDTGFDPNNEQPVPDSGDDMDQLRRRNREARRRARAQGDPRPRRQRASRQSRQRTKAEQVVNFPHLERALDEATSRMVRDVKATQRKQIENLVTVGQRILDRAQGGATFESLTQQVADVKIRYQTQVAASVQRELVSLYRTGQESIAEEFQKQGARYDFTRPLDPGDVARVKDFLGLRARALASLLSDRIRSAWTWEMLSQLRDGRSNRQALASVMVGLSDREIERLAGNTVTEALNLGRNGAAEENARAVRRVEYSALMDGGTCSPCADLDGATFEFGSPEYRAARPPFRECEGRGRCRCVYVYVFADEAE